MLTFKVVNKRQINCDIVNVVFLNEQVNRTFVFDLWHRTSWFSRGMARSMFTVSRITLMDVIGVGLDLFRALGNSYRYMGQYPGPTTFNWIVYHGLLSPATILQSFSGLKLSGFLYYKPQIPKHCRTKHKVARDQSLLLFEIVRASPPTGLHFHDTDFNLNLSFTHTRYNLMINSHGWCYFYRKKSHASIACCSFQ